jgi:RNA polymerase-binding transcription factor DksA
MADANPGGNVDRELDRIADDLVGVEIALERLDAGTYWTCEATGEDLPDELLAADPVARRMPSAPPNDPLGR